MPVASIIVAALAVIAAFVGGAVVIIHPETLTFHEYLDALGVFAIGGGLLGVGRGVHAAAGQLTDPLAGGVDAIPEHTATIGRIPPDEGDAGRPSA